MLRHTATQPFVLVLLLTRNHGCCAQLDNRTGFCSEGKSHGSFGSFLADCISTNRNSLVTSAPSKSACATQRISRPTKTQKDGKGRSKSAFAPSTKTNDGAGSSDGRVLRFVSSSRGWSRSHSILRHPSRSAISFFFGACLELCLVQ